MEAQGLLDGRDLTVGLGLRREEERIQDTGSLLSLSLTHSLLFSELSPPPARPTTAPTNAPSRGPRQEMA